MDALLFCPKHNGDSWTLLISIRFQGSGRSWRWEKDSPDAYGHRIGETAVASSSGG